jgi:hypothetical protein
VHLLEYLVQFGFQRCLNLSIMSLIISKEMF